MANSFFLSLLSILLAFSYSLLSFLFSPYPFPLLQQYVFSLPSLLAIFLVHKAQYKCLVIIKLNNNGSNCPMTHW